MKFIRLFLFTSIAVIGCSEKTTTAFVSIKNDFNNPDLDRRPPWTIIKASYMDVDFGKILIGETSAQKTVSPGIDYVLMIASWNDTTGAVQNCLPVASKVEEEVVSSQTRTIFINAPNHWGPCPPEGVAPIDSALYERVRAKWPEYGFEPYSTRQNNPKCVVTN